ncbi:MAG TPA: peptide ABC transporter substrate-binding protein [Bdellovibrionales bacterium]|nr:peptide ABC transporter substrate-binding protein [Bdellovibrionales bacterium]
MIRCSSKLILAGLIAIASVACTKKGQNIEVDLAGGEKLSLALNETLRINITSEPPSLDWHKASDTTSSWITENTMEGLTAFDLNDKELGLIPALALKWEPSEGNKKWKFTLRQGVVWSDGQPFTSQNVVDGWKRLLSRETAAMYAYFLFPIKGAQAFNEGKGTWETVGIKNPTPDTVEVELEKPMAFFPTLLTHHSTYPIRKDVVDKHGDRWTEAANIVTIGAFNMKSWQHDKMIVLERNEKYYEAEKPSIKYIAAYMIQEQATAINLFDSGKLDSVHKLPSVELRKQRERKEFRQAGSLLMYYYGFNTKAKPVDNPLVRKALAQAIDRQEIVNMLAGGQMPLTSWVPPGMFGHEPSRGMAFNIEKAKEALKAAGYADPAKLPKITIYFNTNEDHGRVAENVQAQLKRNLGINVELKNEEWKVYINTLNNNTPQMWRMGWMADYPDPDNFLNLMTSYSDNNHTHWGSKRFDEIIVTAASEGDKEKRRKLYDEAQKIMLEDDTIAVPLYSGVNLMLIGTRVENYPVNVLEKYTYKRTKLK